MIIKRFLLLLFLTAFYLLPAAASHAQDFTNNYQVEYQLTENKDSLNARVNFRVTITNLRSDVYVSRFAITFPKSFIIHNLKVSDDNGEISPKLTTDGIKTKIEMEFNRPNTGRGSVNTFTLQFNQENLFKINGNVWEVILPTIENRENSPYKIIVNLPENTSKKISISKPKPDLISGNQIIWNNPSVRTIYAVFGDNQLYKLQLAYHLTNPKVIPVVTEIALPPDGLFQKLYLQSINPKPISVYNDSDGNYLARYFLKPTERLTVNFTGIVEIFAKPRTEVQRQISESLNNQKNYLLSAQKYWSLTSTEKIKNLTTPSDIFYFVSKNLAYNYKRVTAKQDRLGADNILLTPDQAVCMEFTDLFIAIAREKGIYSREIEGYGFSQDPELRPLSLASDVLHAWPEYYDSKTNLWQPVDPTWENTSGIDYFSSFDLNHIVFAIHGKRPDYPLPAGMYKTEDSKDVSVQAVTSRPEELINISLNPSELPNKITDNQKYKIKLRLENKGNTYVWNIPVIIEAKNLDLSPNKINIPVLSPMEKKETVINLNSSVKNRQARGELNIQILGKTALFATISIVPYYYELALKIIILVFGISLIFFLVKIILKRK